MLWSCVFVWFFVVFFFKQKTAYEMRISDWSSDVCSSDLVFRSDQRHRKALPRFLTLVVVSGAVSYGMIVFLNHQFGMPVIAAKILAETTLYFVNFLIQREFVFRRRRRLNG